MKMRLKGSIVCARTWLIHSSTHLQVLVQVLYIYSYHIGTCATQTLI